MSAPRKKPADKAPPPLPAVVTPSKAEKPAEGDVAHKEAASLPEPIELATLAASLCPTACLGTGAKNALEKAMALYVAAVQVHSEFTKLSSDEFSEKNVGYLCDMGFEETLLTAIKASNDLRLYKKEREDDPVKQYLLERAKGFDWKKTRSVLTAIKNYFIYCANTHNQKNTAKIAELQAVHEQMARERNTTVDNLRNGMGIPNDQRWQDWKQKYDDFLAKAQQPQPEEEIEYLSPKNNKIEVKIKSITKVEYWLIGKELLDHLIKWRRNLKKRRVSWKNMRPMTRDEIYRPTQGSIKAAKKKNPK